MVEHGVQDMVANYTLNKNNMTPKEYKNERRENLSDLNK